MYLSIHLAPGVPDGAGDEPLFLDVSNAEPLSSKSSSVQAPSSFKFGKALKGAASSSSACSTRGDGKFEGGASFMQRGNVVTLSADALAPANAEATLKQIDDMQASHARQRPNGSQQLNAIHKQNGTAANSTPNNSESTAKQHQQPRGGTSHGTGGADDVSLAGLSQLFQASDLSRIQLGGKASNRTIAEIPGSLLFDISDSIAPGSSTTSTTPPLSTPPSLAAPKHTLVCLQADSGSSLPQRFELTVELALLEHVSQAVVDVEPSRIIISAPGLYLTLKVLLPHKVEDSHTKAKWNKAKRLLVLTVPTVEQNIPVPL